MNELKIKDAGGVKVMKSCENFSVSVSKPVYFVLNRGIWRDFRDTLIIGDIIVISGLFENFWKDT